MFLGAPLVALLVTSLYAMAVLGFGGGRGLKEVSDLVGASFAAIAGILLIVGAGGGFKETLVASGVADVIGDWLEGAAISPLLAAWLVKEYFGMTVPQTLNTWLLMETILSVVGLVSVLFLGLVV